jgi:cell wall-associated NlpC family hydrolase
MTRVAQRAFETEGDARAAVVAEALSWVGTRYHHMGTIKQIRDADGTLRDRGGVDCATLLTCVYANAGIIGPVVVGHYPPDWHMHQGAERYLRQLLTHTTEIEEAAAQPGDIVLFRWGRVYSHGAIIIAPGWPDIVHAYSEARMVIADHGDKGRHSAVPRRFFSPWEPKS